MALESATYISGLVSTNPTSSDNVGEGDNHLRLIKSTLLATFPSVTGAVTKSHTQLNTSVDATEAATNANTASTIVKRDASGNFTAGTVTANLTGNVTGNASTASAWSAARTITLGGDLTGSVSLDGSGNVTLSAQVNDDSHAHIISNVDGLQSALDSKLGVSANAVSASKWQTARTLTLAGDLSGSVSIDGSGPVTLSAQVQPDSHTHDGRYFTEGESDARYLGISANAASASKWQTARTLSLSNHVSGSTSFDGSGNANISVTVLNNSHSHTISNVTGLQTALDGKLSTSGTAAAATRLATARSISLTGDASGSTTFDGSGNVSISVVVADSSHAHSISTVSGLQAALDAKLGSTATATNSTKWGGYNVSTSATGTDASTIYFRT